MIRRWFIHSIFNKNTNTSNNVSALCRIIESITAMHRLISFFPFALSALSCLGFLTRSGESFNMLPHTASLSATAATQNRGGDDPSNSRRDFFSKALVATFGMTTVAATTLQQPALAANEETDGPTSPMIDVYFGCGCFWHVQHEFVEAERRILGRTDETLTARVGYAGGKAGALNNKVCYHNALSISDYGSLGHAEVVRLQIPQSSFVDFVTEYCNLFSEQGYRPDQFGDRGPEYRNLVGIPGGVEGAGLTKQLVDTSVKAGDKLSFARGKGDDSDQRALVWVMDSNEFPFYIAEQYHQFHDGFNFGEDYPNSYNNLAAKLRKQGQLEKSDCPNGLIGVGALGL